MCLKKCLVLLLLIKLAVVSSSDDGFVFNGLVELNGVSEVRTNASFKLSAESTTGQILYYHPLMFKNDSSSSSSAKASSFSTNFVFAIVPNGKFPRGYGLLFTISPSNNLSRVNNYVGVEFDTFRNLESYDIDDNHVGIDVNGSLVSVNVASAAYFNNQTGEWESIDLASGEPIQAWVEYDGLKPQLNVTISPVHMVRPKLPLLSMDIDLSPLVLEQMYVGFGASTGQLMSSQYVLGWSFQMNGKAEDLDVSKLPSLPATKNNSNKKQIILAVVLSITGVILLVTGLSATFKLVRRKKETFTEIFEDWEVEFGPHRFAYKDLVLATRGFDENELLGQGGFGKVFKGELPVSKEQIAVKKISHKSDQGMKEFVAEIGTIGRLRHPNLVRLLGYCRGEDELLLVYDYMPNGSLDMFLHKEAEITLSWSQRYSIIKDVAYALAYLHEGWAEIIIHRDIKASNVLLDGEFNGKLGDFGLARCSKHEHTTHVAGTYGYMAPEIVKTGKASTSTDVYAFGVFCLEVACGRRPIKSRAPAEEVHLVDWVLKCWKEGDILKTADSKLGNHDFKVGEIDLVLKLGLFCSHNVATLRPKMSQVVLYLSGQDSLPQNLDAILQTSDFLEEPNDNSSAPWSRDSTTTIATIAVTESFQSRGR